MRPDNEREWIARARDGSDEAFAHIVELYQRSVFNLCYRMLGNAQEAEDAAQETFLKAFLGLKRYDDTRGFRTWLLSIGAHECIDRLRRRRFEWVSLDSLLGRGQRSEGPESQMEHTFTRERLQMVISRLPTVDRAAIILRYWNELSYEEIAEALSLSTSAVKSRLHRAKKLLAERWMESSESDLSALPIEKERGKNEAAAV